MLPTRTSHLAVIAAVVLSSSGCNTRNDIFGTPTSPTSTGPALPTPTASVLRMTLDPPAMTGGATATGTITLSLPAPAGGTVVQLSPSDPALLVPSEVTVPEGSETTTFLVRTPETSSDRQITVVASTPTRTVSTTLSLWAPVPMSFSFVSDRGDWVGQGRVERMTQPTASFRVRCAESELEVTAERSSGDYFRASLAAPRGTPMAVGTYENATRTAFRAPGAPGIDIAGQGRGCNRTSGRFVVHAFEWTTTSVQTFWATFEQHCEAGVTALRGEVRITNLPLPAGSGACRR